MVAKRQGTQGAEVACVDGGGAVWTAENKFEKRSKKQGARSRRLIEGAVVGAAMLPMIALGVDAQVASFEPMAKMDGSLSQLYAQHQSGLGESVPTLRTAELQFKISELEPTVFDGKVVIDATASGNAATLLKDLQALGLEKGSAFGRVVSGRLPIGALEEASLLGSLQFARAAVAAANVGSVTSEGDPAMLSDLTRLAFRVKGRRITIGVLSDSYDCLGGAATDIATGDLPPARRITILDDGACPGSDEGRAMMQLIRDVAPRANQAFHTAFNNQADFANGIVELAQAGAEVIVDDVIYLAEPMFQDGIIAQAVDQVKAQGVAYFSSAGNNGRNSWDTGPGGFQSSGNVGIVGLRHDFDPGPGVADLQTFEFGVGQTTVILQWDQPYASVSGPPGSASDMNLALYAPDGTPLFATTTNSVGGDPVEGFTVTVGAPLRLLLGVELTAGPQPGRVKYVVFDPRSQNINDPPTSFPVDFATNSSTNYGHSNAAGAAGVGASFWRQTPPFGVFPPRINAFSSAGGTPILFDTDGLPVE